MSKYSDVAKKISRHNQIEYVESTFGRLTFRISEREFDVLRYLSDVLDEKELEIERVVEKDNGILFVVEL